MRIKIGIFLLLVSFQLKAQKFTISGSVRDSATGEFLIGANIGIPEISTGCVSNAYGFYSLTLPAGNYNLKIEYLGCPNQWPFS